MLATNAVIFPVPGLLIVLQHRVCRVQLQTGAQSGKFSTNAIALLKVIGYIERISPEKAVFRKLDEVTYSSSAARLKENIRATDVQLSDDEINRIEDAFPKGAVAGERYASSMIKILNG